MLFLLVHSEGLDKAQANSTMFQVDGARSSQM